MAGSQSIRIEWPSDARPARVVAPFSAASGSLAIAAPAGTAIKAGAAGKVTVVSLDSVQVSAGGFMVVYGNLRALKVQTGQDVTIGQVLGESAGPDSIRLMVLQTVDPTALLVEPAAEAPRPEPFYVCPTQTGVRVREAPVSGKPVSQISPQDICEALEPAADARKKVGVANEWLRLRTPSGVVGFSACQFLEVYTGPIPASEPQPAPPSTPPAGFTPTPTPTPITSIVPGLLNITGMNLDMHNPLGHPRPERLKGMGWIRVKFNVSFNPDNGTYGNTDVDATFNRVRPFLEPYVRAGLKVVMVFTHQLFGEGAGYHWPSMNTGTWNDFIPKYADYARRAAFKFAGLNLVHAYQVWNEQDTRPENARAAVPIPARDYANMLTQTIKAIRSVDRSTPIVTGGHVGGPDAGGAYARQTLAAMPADTRPDGIASHPYGRGVTGHKFSPFGPLAEEIRKYGAVLPDKPVWFTEWGVLDFQGNMSVVQDVTSYATGFMNIIKSQFPNQVAAAIWYAWADGMDNGYGLVDSSDNPKRPLMDQFLKL